MAHEIAHVLLHIKIENDRCILDNLDEENISDIEIEADAEAGKMLKTKEILTLSKPFMKYFSEVNLKNISKQLGIEISVILGILQHNKIVDYRKLNKYKKKVKPLFPPEIVMG